MNFCYYTKTITITPYRDQVAVFGGRKKRKGLLTFANDDAISRQKIDIRVGMVPVL